jgi:putative RecB family exonuclease
MIALATSPKKPGKQEQAAALAKVGHQPILDELKATISASRLSTFHQCRLRFFFQYVLELQRPKHPSLHVGQCVHHVLKAWNRARWHGTELGNGSLHAIYALAWSEQQEEESVRWENEEEEEQQKQTGWSLLETYFRDSPLKQEVKPEGVEVSVETDLASHGLPVLVGVLDLVQEGRIVDFKTTSSTPNPATAAHANEVQACSYALLYRAATGETEKGIEFHHLVKLKTPKLVVTALQPMNEQQQTRLFRLIESYVEGVDRQDFVPSPGLGCLSCPFFKECRAWN